MAWNDITPSVGVPTKTSSLESVFCMDHARIFKGTRSSVAAPHPFEIPLLALVGRIPRTGFAGCCGRPSGVALGATFKCSFSFYAVITADTDSDISFDFANSSFDSTACIS